jgi:hypothetical protein
MSHSTNAPAESDDLSREAPPDKIYLVSYPKIIFCYPLFLMSLVAGIAMLMASDKPLNADNELAVAVAIVFLAVFAINLVVFSFDFPRGTSLALFFFFAAVVLGAALLFQFRPDLLPRISDVLRRFRPVASASFYFFVAGFLALIYAGVLLNVRFDYWEVRPNELLHHHGVLSDLKRYPAPNLRVDKEISDIFEYLLLGSGKLILHPSGEARSIVLDNVIFISAKEKALTRMLGALQVQVRRPTAPE